MLMNELMNVLPLIIIPPPQPFPKRARQETSGEEEYSRYIQSAENALKALQALTEDKANTTAPPPLWLQTRLEELQVLITQISAARHKS